MRRRLQVPLYVLVVMVATMFVSPLVSIVASVRISENRAAQTRQEQADIDRRVKAEATRQTCLEFSRLIDVFDTSETRVGRDVRDLYVFLYNLIKCHPPRK